MVIPKKLECDYVMLRLKYKQEGIIILRVIVVNKNFNFCDEFCDV